MKAIICDLCKTRYADVGILVEHVRATDKRIRIVGVTNTQVRSHVCNRCIATLQDHGGRPDILTFPGQTDIRA